VTKDFGGSISSSQTRASTALRPWVKMSDAVWNDVVAVNLTGTANTFSRRDSLRGKRPAGRLVAILRAAGAASRRNYCATKWGIIGLVKSVAMG